MGGNETHSKQNGKELGVATGKKMKKEEQRRDEKLGASFIWAPLKISHRHSILPFSLC